MIFQNVNYAARNKFIRLIIMVIFAAVTVSFIFIEKIDRYAFGLTRFLYIGIIISIYIIYNLIRNAKKYYFIYYSDLNGKILFRFYHIRMFAKKYKAYEIPQEELHSYEIKKMGMVNSLILTRMKNGKKMDYPPISINSLTDSELFSITTSLDKFKTI